VFNDNRGQTTLLPEEHRGEKLKLSLQRPFNSTKASVILMHLVTDLCFHEYDSDDSASNKVAHLCREMSNYMSYLLFVNPDMLMPGALGAAYSKKCSASRPRATVWLLWYMGMETLAEKMQRTEAQAQGDIGATGPKSASRW
jgi:hypothetical protein